MKNSADLGGCYPPRPSASVDNTLLDLQNSSYPTQPHSIIAKYKRSVTFNSSFICVAVSYALAGLRFTKKLATFGIINATDSLIQNIT